MTEIILTIGLCAAFFSGVSYLVFKKKLKQKEAEHQKELEKIKKAAQDHHPDLVLEKVVFHYEKFIRFCLHFTWHKELEDKALNWKQDLERKQSNPEENFAEIIAYKRFVVLADDALNFFKQGQRIVTDLPPIKEDIKKETPVE